MCLGLSRLGTERLESHNEQFQLSRQFLMLLACPRWPGPMATPFRLGPFLFFTVFPSSHCCSLRLAWVTSAAQRGLRGIYIHTVPSFCRAVSSLRWFTPQVMGRANQVRGTCSRNRTWRWSVEDPLTLLPRNAVTNALARAGADQASEEKTGLWPYCLLQCRIGILKLDWVIKTIEKSLLLCQQTYSGVWAGSFRPARANCNNLED